MQTQILAVESEDSRQLIVATLYSLSNSQVMVHNYAILWVNSQSVTTASET